MTRLDKRNREDQLASFIVERLAHIEPVICGSKVRNVRFSASGRGFFVDLEDGNCIRVEITALKPAAD